MSATGARLVMSDATTLPDVFDLYIPQRERTFRASLRWRREDGIGVTFADAQARASAAAVAADPAATDASVSILLRRIGELETENAALRRLLASTARTGEAASAA